jgi:hypothetical protein
VDIAYLYYLPFCTLFVSSDKLHRQCAPLFMRTKQEFVWGLDLKADLSNLNIYFSGLPEELKQQGIYKFANRLPAESKGLIRKLFERHTPNLLKTPEAVEQEKIDKNAHKKLLDDMQLWESAPTMATADQESTGELETIIIKRAISRNRGSWVQIGPEIVDDGT